MKKITSNDFEKNLFRKTKRWLSGLSFCLMMLFGQTIFAQVNAYGFAQSDGVYSSIETDGVAVTETIATATTTFDTSGWNIPLPFTFNFNSSDFSSIYVNSNGGATFGTTTSTTSAIISATTAYSGAIGVMNRDLWGNFVTSGVTTTGSNVITNVASFKGLAVGKLLRTGSGVAANTTVTAFDEVAGTITMSAPATSGSATASVGWGSGVIYTKVDGEAPNRVFTIQWEGYNDYGTTSTSSNYLSFQLKLSETTNTVRIVFGPNFNVNTTSRTNQIGLRGATNTDFNNRLGAVGNSWSSTTQGTANNSTVSRDNTNFPASGLTFTWTPPTCLPPATLTATNITTTSVDLGWTSSGTLFDVEWGTQGFTLGTGTAITGVTTPPSLSGLTPSTSYSFYVRTDCGATDGVSNWAGPYNFTTLCVPVTTFSENFDSYTATGSANPLPNCWSRFGNTGNSYITTVSAAPFTPPNRLYLNASATGPTNAIAVMPPVSNLQAETHRIRFKAYCTTANKSLEIGYYETADDASSFTVLETFAMPAATMASATQFIYTPEFVPAGVQSIAFRLNGGAFTGTTTIYVDDVVWEVIPGCADITAIEISNVTASTADVLWTTEGTENAWDYVYAVSTVTDPNTLTPATVNNNPFIDLSGLMDNTNYKLWIRSNCGSGVVGNWSSAQTFKTACLATTAFSEDFDSSPTGSTNPLPNCWLKAGNGNTYITTGGVAPGTPPNRLYMSASGTLATPTTSIAIMPEVSNLSAGTHRLKFRAYATSANKTVEIGYYADATDLSSYVPLQTINITTTTAATAAQYSYIPVGVPDGVTKFALKNAGLPTATTLYIDNVAWEPVPLCPDVTGVTFVGATATTASISWTPGGSETVWEYVVGLATVTDPSTLTPVEVVGNPEAIISPLLPSTNYKVWVRSKCGTNLGAFSSPVTFLTACLPITTLPWTEGFEDIATVGTNAFPPCWSEQNGDWASAVTSTYNTPRTGTKYIRDSWSATNEFMWTPGFELTANTSYDFSFFMQGDGWTGWNVDVFYNTVQNSTDATQIGNTVSPAGTNTTALQPYSSVTTTFVPTTTGVYYFAIRVNQPSSSPWYIAFDDFKLELSPNCVAPVVQPATNVTSATATLNWDAPFTPPANGYEYLLTTDTTLVPDATTVPTNTVAAGITFVDVTGLDSNTAYRYYVRGVCAPTDKSSWSSPSLFTTPCVLVTTFSENFDSSLTGTANPLPSCWLRAGNGSTYVTTGGVAPGTPPNRLYMSANGTLATPTTSIAIMPEVSNLAAGTHRLKFRAYATVANKTIEIGYFADSSNLDSYVPLETIAITTTTAATAAAYSYIPVGVPAGVTKFALKNAGLPASTTLYIDDVVWEPIPSCPDVNSVNFIGATATTASISWTPGGSETVWEYVVGLATVTDPSTLTPVEVVGNPEAVISPLLPSTNYKVWVRSKCGTNLGAFSTPITFLTACLPVSTLPWTEGFEGIATVSTTAFPPCWFEQNGDWSSAETGSSTYNTPRTGSKYIRDQWSATNEFMWTPGFEMTAGTSYDFSFYMQGDGFTGWNVDVFYNTVQNSTDAVQLGSTVTATGTGTYVIQPYQLVSNTFVPTTSGVYYFAVRVNQPSGTPWYIAFDDFSLALSPECAAPVTAATTNITTTTATINWAAPATAPAAGYEYFVTTSADLPNATTVPTGSVAAGITTKDLTNLTSSSNYRFYVRSVCSTTDISDWSQAGMFSTLCDTTPLPYLIDFNSSLDMPICTSTANAGTGNNWTIGSDSTAGFPTNALEYIYNSDSAANAWFFTNLVSLTAGQQYSISYNYGSNSTFFVEKLRVAYGTSATVAAMTTELANHPNINQGVAQSNTVLFTPTVTGVYSFGFNAYSIADQFNLYVDNINIQVSLSNTDFDNNSFVAYPNPVKNNLTVRYNENITDLSVFNLLGQQLLVKKINATEGQVDMSNFPTGTYLIKVTSGDRMKTIKVMKE